MVKTPQKIEFPSNWDENNVGAVDFFNRCLPYVKKTEDFYDIAGVSIYFIVFGVIAIGYILFINIWLLSYYKSYIFKRQSFKYYLCLLVGSLMILLDTYFLEIYYEHYPCFLHHLFTAIGYPTYLSAIVFIILRYYKFYYKSQIAYFNSFMEFLEEKHNEMFNKKFIFKICYTSISPKKAFNIFIFINIISVIYSILIYFVDKRVSSNGFCGTRISYLPQIMEFAFILLIFSPLALIEALKFDDKFRMKKTVVLLILVHIIYFTGFFLGALVKKLNCSVFVQYTPPGFFVFLSCVTCTRLFSFGTLKDILHVTECNKNLKVTRAGMDEMLYDKVLFREFGEYCRNENCVENILFLQEYWKYKKLFAKNNATNTKISEISDPESSIKSRSREGSIAKLSVIGRRNTLLGNSKLNEHGNTISSTTKITTDRKTSIMSSSRLNERAMSVITIPIIEKSDLKTYYSTVEREARKFYNNFIVSNAIYEINIQSSIINQIVKKITELEESSDNTEEERIEDYSTLFDDAYKEVCDNIYLNSYSNYVHMKNKEQSAQEKSKKKKETNN
ncbi:hypothetical protein BCR32DRAFT_291034 [Anaeromyces robustus]|uniref:RGS domain-containing protein n=1 Tax=Anaeromyces robustus TaxID=1754192 RepID=A0A1Y1XGI6_9FUNG|nr:hypothetical protein BCR32DRAFT_291034 [Anaeromyces robustus]|eukprot:ORX84865.1 hypothetical protein BCR32DRAFT_291034 [Anaeromyces robustus]